MEQSNLLIERIRQAAAHQQAKLYPPAPPSLIESAESQLGFPLPDLLRRLFLEVGNGGFGPAGQIIGLEGGFPNDHDLSITDIYLLSTTVNSDGPLPAPDDPTWRWPQKLLSFYSWGSGIYSCLDCSQSPAPVIHFDPHYQPWRDAFFWHYPSLAAWLEAWLDGTDLWRQMYPSGFECVLPQLKNFGQENSTNQLTQPKLPLWLKHPEIPRFSIGWRMGYGEAYLIEWADWYQALTSSDQQKYQSLFPPPEDWFGFYDPEEE